MPSAPASSKKRSTSPAARCSLQSSSSASSAATRLTADLASGMPAVRVRRAIRVGFAGVARHRPARLLATGGDHHLGHHVRESGDDRPSKLWPVRDQREHLVRAVPVAAASAALAASESPSTCGRSSTATACPSGISAVRQGASRASRSTSRSTTIFAIRRHVVSLPPVIVIMPLEVSYSSALREMSTDFFVSPVEISGRTPA